MRIVIVIISFLLGSGFVSGQKSIVEDSLKAESFFSKGVSFRAQGEFDNALNAFDSAMYYFMIAQDTGLYFITITDKSWCYILTGQFEKALELNDEALHEVQQFSFDSEGIFYRQKGIIYSNMSDFESSLENFIKAKAVAERKYGKEHNRYARALGDLSVSYHRMGQLDKALEYRMIALSIEKKNGAPIRTQINANLNLGAIYYEISDYKTSLDFGTKALELSFNDPNEVVTTTADLYENVGNCYKAMGQYEKAIDHYEKAMAIRRKAFGDTHYKIANTYQNLANCYSQLGDSKRALEAYKDSYAMRVETLGETHLRTIEGLKHVGVGYLDNEQYEEAEDYLLRALNQERVKHGDTHNEICITLNNLGHLNRKTGNYEKAIEYDQLAAEMFIQLYGEKGVLLSRIYESMSRTYLDMKDYQQAIDVLNKALIANGMTLGDDPYSPPVMANYSRLRSVLESMMLKIDILEASDLDVNASSLVIQHVDSISKMIQELKVNFSNKEDLFFLIEVYHDFVGKGVNHLHKIYSHSKDEEIVFQALSYIESSKDNLLTQKLYHINARDYAGVPDSILLKEQILVTELEEAKNQFSTNDSIQKVNDERTFNLKQEFEQMTTDLRKQYPAYYQLNYESSEVSTAKLKSFTGTKDFATLSFFMEDEELFSILVSGKKIQFNRVSLDNSFYETVNSFRSSISNVNSEEYPKLASILYQQLLGDHEDFLGQQSVVIVADGILSTIPFEVLQRADGKYFLENNVISYSSSLNYLMASNRSNVGNQQYVGFAPSFDQNPEMSDPVRSELVKLPGATDEINSVSSLLNGTSFMNENASESNFRNVATQFGLIHLATHAIIDDANPDASKLIFSLKEDSLNDGYLHAYEIYNLELNADLITLSACNTGFGEIRKGEGVMSLSRAFAYAGVPSTVVSLWPASDKSAPELMTYFYQNLKEGKSKDVALNNARKQYLATAEGKARHPFYWGGFVMIGDNSPIEEGTNLLVWLIPSLIIISMILVLYRRKYKVT